MRVDWMRALSTHYEEARKQYPGEPLMLLSDIDGTIIDMRHLILQCMWGYDRHHKTRYFERLRLEDISVHENQIEDLLGQLKIPNKERKDILNWFIDQRWRTEVILENHRPFRGVLDMIRWFQIQPNSSVGLVTGRPEKLREDTLRSLNKLGKQYRVSFSDDLLYMNPGDWEENVQDVKVAGLKHFRQSGYHVYAFIDNEPAILKALEKSNPDNNLLLLHANTIFETKRTRVPRGTVRGNNYRLEELIPDEVALPSHVQLAWHGVNDEPNLRQFLASDVQWAEVDARMEPSINDIILRHDSFDNSPTEADENWLMLEDVLSRVQKHERGIKIDLKSGDGLVERVLEMLEEMNFEEENLWFNGNIEELKEDGFRLIAEAHPDAIIQCPIDFLDPLILATPQKAHETLNMFTTWGINRFSISWDRADLRELFDQMAQWEYQINIYNVPDLETFLQAVLLFPRSVTSDFNFPQWNYYGRGSGRGGERVTYEIRKPK